MSTFASPAHVTEGWYVLERSRNIKPGRIHTIALGQRELVAYRKTGGAVVALDAQCPHLGAHLSQGRLAGEQVECAFHGWRWAPEGACAAAPGYETLPARRTRAYVTTERWGFVWAWIGHRAPYALPAPDAPADWRIVRPPSRIVKCHPHLMIGNGHDLGHFGALHGFTVTKVPEPSMRGDHEMALEMEGTLPHEGAVKLFGLGGSTFRSTYTTYGGSVVLVKVHAPIEFQVLFTGRPTSEGHTRAQTLAFIPSLWALPRAMAIIAGTTAQDIPLLESVRFRPAYDAQDDMFARYARLVEALPTW